MSVDPLADMMPQWSPYTYTFNNPINLVDADGRKPCPPGVDCVGNKPDNKGIIRNVSDSQAASSWLGGLQRGTFDVLVFLSLNDLDNSVADEVESCLPTKERVLEAVKTSFIQ